MKHFRFALTFVAAALLLIVLGRPSGDQTPAPHPAAPSSVAATSDSSRPQIVPESLPEASASPAEGRAQSPAPAAAEARAALPIDEEPHHPGEKLEGEAIVRRHGNQPLTRNHPDVAAVIQVQERNTRWLMANPAVVGTAVGLNDDAALAIIVYTKADAPEIPKAIEGVPVAVWRSGEIFARLRTQDEAAKVKGNIDAEAKGNGNKPSPGPTVDPTDRFTRPVPIGVSTGHFNITAGTIGCRVLMGATPFALSNNHVYADENKASILDNVLQPGRVDGGVNPTDAIGRLIDFAPIAFSTQASNTIDAAIAEGGNVGDSTPVGAGYGRPRASTTLPAIGMSVKKYGRTTRLTTAQIGSINATILVGYDSGTARFVQQVVVNGRNFSAGGDSGSLIVANDLRPVGLLFAGGGRTTIANEIGLVLSYFGVTIDGAPDPQ